MPNAGLDEISRLLGNIERDVANLRDRANEDRDVGDRRHTQNQAAIDANVQAVLEVRRIVEPLSQAIAVMRPTVDMLVMSRSRLISLAALGLAALSAIGWVAETVLKWAVTAVLSHWH